jgi:ubiquinone/menaquinone biosynthesis C-methylase UbiE
VHRVSLRGMRRPLVLLAWVFLSGTPALAGQPAAPTPAEIAAKLENASQAAYRYRVAIAGLMNLKPGMVAAEVATGSGYVARAMAAEVGPSGRVIASTADPRMAEYITDRARTEGLANVSAVMAPADGTGLAPSSIDAAAIVNGFSALPRQAAVLAAVAAALKPGGVLLIVDVPREGQGATQSGIDADEVVALAAAAGFTREAESSVVPGQYALRFRRK